jgi:hypothetical protein
MLMSQGGESTYNDRLNNDKLCTNLIFCKKEEKEKRAKNRWSD